MQPMGKLFRASSTANDGNPDVLSWATGPTASNHNTSGVLRPGATADAPNVLLHAVHDEHPSRPEQTSKRTYAAAAASYPIVPPTPPHSDTEALFKSANDPISRLLGPPEPVGSETRVDLHEVWDEQRDQKVANLNDKDAPPYGTLSRPFIDYVKQWRANVAHVADQLGDINVQHPMDKTPSHDSHPGSYEDFLVEEVNNVKAPFPGPRIGPAVSKNPTLEDVLRLFEQLRYVTPRSILYDTNDRIHLPDGSNIASNITAVADECRNRYLGDRRALIRALGQLLEVEKLIALPLGHRTWENLDFKQPPLQDHWQKQCMNHIDKIMLALEKVEMQVERCFYRGNWEIGWTADGRFPKNKDGKEIGNRRNSS